MVEKKKKDGEARGQGGQSSKEVLVCGSGTREELGKEVTLAEHLCQAPGCELHKNPLRKMMIMGL